MKTLSLSIASIVLVTAITSFSNAAPSIPNPTALGWSIGDPYATSQQFVCCQAYLTNPDGGSLGKQLGYTTSVRGQRVEFGLPNTFIPDLKPQGSEVTHAAGGNDGYIEGVWPLPDKGVLFATKVMPSGLSYLYKMDSSQLVGNNATHDNKQAVLNLGERNGVHQLNVGILHQGSVLVAKINNATVVFYGEYSTDSQTPQVALWKSTDFGNTWEKAVEWNNDSIHAVRQNPNNGLIYILLDSGIVAWDGVSPIPSNPLLASAGWNVLTGPANVVSTGDIAFTPAPGNNVFWIPDVHSLAAGEQLLSQRANADLSGLTAGGEVPFVNGHPPILSSLTPVEASGVSTWISGIDADVVDKKIHVWETSDFGLNWVLRSKVDVYNNTEALPSGFYGGLAGRELEFVATGQRQGSVVDPMRAPYLIQNVLSTQPDSFTADNLSFGNSIFALLNDNNPEADLIDATYVLTQPQHGTVQPAAPIYDRTQTNNYFIYTPTPGYVGPDSFTYALKNTAGTSNVSEVSITVADNRPVANDDTFTVQADSGATDLDITANDTLGNITNPAIEIVTPPSNGDGGLPYAPRPGFVGVDTFTYYLYDPMNSALRSDIATVTINVIGPAKPFPVTVPDTAETTKDKPVTINILANDKDVSNSIINFDGGPYNGTIEVNNDTVIYTPYNGYVGDDSFTYQLMYTSPNGNVYPTNISTVSIKVTETPTPVNPVANPDRATTQKGDSVKINLTSNDTNVGNSKVVIVKRPQNAEIKFADNTRQSVIFEPKNNFVGQTSFQYKLQDGATSSNITTVTVDVVKKQKQK